LVWLPIHPTACTIARQQTTQEYPTTNITALVEAFAKQLVAVTEAAASERIQAALSSAFGVPAKRGPGRPPKQAAVAAEKPAKKPVVGRKPLKLSPKGLKVRRLQGQYLGALRALTGANRAKVKAVAKDKGVAEAVKLALTLKVKK
jgi:hypothetical protein